VLLEVVDGDVFAMGVFRLVYGRADNLASDGLFAVGEEVSS